MITYYGLWVKPQYAGPADYDVEVCTSSDWNSGKGSRAMARVAYIMFILILFNDPSLR